MSQNAVSGGSSWHLQSQVKVMGIKQQVLCPQGESLADWAESTGRLVPSLFPESATRCRCPLSVLWSSGWTPASGALPPPLPSPRSLFTEALRPPPPHHP